MFLSLVEYLTSKFELGNCQLLVGPSNRYLKHDSRFNGYLFGVSEQRSLYLTGKRGRIYIYSRR